ncbi:hypothetical protein EDB80DRAFT_771076 [Ilyonectria destructans]|nr:hypothetical protein EDB80DRAFT_771076 [Ilyonectria destructans]
MEANNTKTTDARPVVAFQHTSPRRALPVLVVVAIITLTAMTIYDTSSSTNTRLGSARRTLIKKSAGEDPFFLDECVATTPRISPFLAIFVGRYRYMRNNPERLCQKNPPSSEAYIWGLHHRYPTTVSLRVAFATGCIGCDADLLATGQAFTPFSRLPTLDNN